MDDTSQEIQRALKAVEEQKSCEGGSLASRMYDSLKDLLYILVANGYVEFCKKYCIFDPNKIKIKEFTFAPTVLENDTLIKITNSSYSNVSIIWHRFKIAHKYWHTNDSDFSKYLKNCTLYDKWAIKDLRNEIIINRPENVSNLTQRQKVFTSNFFRDGLEILITHIYKTL